MVTLQSAKLVAETICLLTVAGAAAYTAWDLHESQIQIRSTITSLNQGVRSTLDTVNRPCGPGGPCGLLAEINKTLVKIQDISVTTQRQVAQSATLVNAASSSLSKVADAASETAHSASGTLQAAQTTIQGLQPLESAATVNLQHLTPVEDASRQSIEDFDAILKDQAIHRTAENIAGMTDSGNQILFDFRKVADKTTADYLKPTPWYLQPVKKIGDIWDIGAAVARHAP